MSGGGGRPSQPSGQPITKTERALAEIARDKYARHKTTGRKVEKEYIKEASRVGSQAEKDRVAGVASTTINAGAGQPTGGNANELISREGARTAGLSRSAVESDIETEKRGNRATESVIGIGRDVENTGVQGLTREAANETAEARSIGEAQNILNASRFATRAARNASYADMAGTAVGFGMYNAAAKQGTSGLTRNEFDPADPRSASIDYDYLTA